MNKFSSRRILNGLVAVGAALALTAGVGGTVLAQEAKAGKSGYAKSTAEMQEKARERTAAIDANRDGYITVEEISAHHEAMRLQHQRERLAKLDDDGDGKVSTAEFEAGQLERIARMDADDDGMIEGREWRRGHHGHHGGFGPHDAPPPPDDE